MNLSHFTSTPLRAIRSAAQCATIGTYDKPNGLWVSVDGDQDWREWCESESFCDINAMLRYSVTLAPHANILVLGGPFGIDAFTAQYALTRHGIDRYGIDWPSVASAYQGIIIAPYCWQRRMSDHTSWYYGWDCASGCIWDASAIGSINMASPLEAHGATLDVAV